MLSRNSILMLVVITLLWVFFAQSYGGELADSKIKNGQLLIEKALASSAEQKANYVYKAKREFERGSLVEPENPWPLYWNSVLSFYLEQDSTNAAKLYQKALKNDTQVLANYPPPWLYKSDANLKSAIKGNFRWVKETQQEIESPVIAQVEATNIITPVVSVNPLDSLKTLIQNKDYEIADSLYKTLISGVIYDTSVSLRLLGLELKLNQGAYKESNDLLENILGRSTKSSMAARTAVALYDKSLQTLLVEAKSVENREQFAEAETLLKKMEPQRVIPASTARAGLHLQYASVLLASNNPAGADSMLQLYLSANYKKSAAYKNIDSRLTLVKNQNKKPVETNLTQIESRQIENKEEIKPQTKPDQYITMVPPKGEIMNVIVNSIDPASRQVQDSKLWETTGPLKLKTGAAYTLTVQRKHERKASLFIAAAGIITTFFVVR